MTGLWQVRRDHAPLCVGQIGLVSGDRGGYAVVEWSASTWQIQS